MAVDEFNATLSYRSDLNRRLSIVRVSPDGGRVPEFEPGQFAVLALPPPPEARQGPDKRRRLIRRAYSIASAPGVSDYLEFYIVLVDDGTLTPMLWTAGPGDRLWLDPRIAGKFTLRDVPADRDLVMVATGTGLGPYMSMLRHYRGRSRWRRFVLIHSAQAQADLGYRDELERIGREDATVRYLPTLTREPPDSAWSGLRGRVQTLLDDRAYERLVGSPLSPEQCHVFLCGHPEMIESVEQILRHRGFRTHSPQNPGQIHYERYW